MTEPSWRAIAVRLAARLENNDFCDNGHASIDEGVKDGCPNCDDRAAMREYRKKARTQPRTQPRRPVGRAVSIHEIRRGDALSE